MGPIERLDDDLAGQPVKRLKAACRRISESCGYGPSNERIEAGS
jgi:hypothetical protein